MKSEIQAAASSEKFIIETVNVGSGEMLQLRKQRRIGTKWLDTDQVIELGFGDANAVGRRLQQEGIKEMRKDVVRMSEGTLPILEYRKKRNGGY